MRWHIQPGILSRNCCDVRTFNLVENVADNQVVDVEFVDLDAGEEAADGGGEKGSAVHVGIAGVGELERCPDTVNKHRLRYHLIPLPRPRE